MNTATIRQAGPQDAEAMLAIYSPFIEQTSITFETTTPDAAQFAKRISDYMTDFPWLVAESGGIIAGYAYASRYRERLAYQWSVECSVYIHPDHYRKGIAQALYRSLFVILQKQGFNNVYAVINLPNDQSVALHEALGFRWFATYDHVGYKLGKWKNVGWWALQLNDYIDDPPAPIPFAQLDKSFIADLFTTHAAAIR